MESRNYKSKIKEHVLVLLLFIVLTSLLTYPVITQLTTHVAGYGGDNFQFIWNIWHINQTLVRDGTIFDIFYTDYQFYPYGTSLAFHTLSLTNTLFLAFPMTLITDNLVVIYNILFFLTFILAGYGMYLLTYYLVKDKGIAFLTGFVYAFSPLHMGLGVIGHLNVASIQWTPFFFLFFFKVFKEQNIRNAIMAAVFLFFLALTSWYHLLFALLIAAPYFIYKFITARYLFTKHFFLRTAMFLFLFGIIILPFVVPVIGEYLKEGINGYYTQSLTYPATLTSYITPGIMHPLLGGRSINFLGYLVPFISLLYLAKAKKHIFWFLIAFFFLLLSIIPPSGVLASFLDKLPILNIIRTNFQFAFGVFFCLFLFFAFSLAHFLPKWKQFINKRLSISPGSAQKILIFLIFVILFLEYLAVPYPTTLKFYATEIEIAYSIGEILQSAHPIFANNFTVLSFPPLRGHLITSIDLYFQTFHERKIIGGYVSRLNPESSRHLSALDLILFEKNKSEFYIFLRKYNIGYIIIHDHDHKDRENEYMDNVRHLLDGIAHDLIFYREYSGRDGGIYVFQVL